MPPAARVGDITGHPGIIAGPGIPSVRIGGQSAAAVGDVHICLFPPLAGPHPTNVIADGSTTVRIGGRAAARMDDFSGCGAPIVTGAVDVWIGG